MTVDEAVKKFRATKKLLMDADAKIAGLRETLRGFERDRFAIAEQHGKSWEALVSAAEGRDE